MRPTDSSLRVPGWLTALAVVCVVAAIVTANFVRGIPLYRFQTFGQRFVGGSDGEDLNLADDRILWTNADASAIRPGGRPMFLLFTDATSPAAERLTHDVLGNGWCAARISRGFLCVRTFVPLTPSPAGNDDARATMERFRVRRLPTIVFLDPQGNELERVEGYPGRSTLMRMVTKWEDRFPSSARFSRLGRPGYSPATMKQRLRVDALRASPLNRRGGIPRTPTTCSGSAIGSPHTGWNSPVPNDYPPQTADRAARGERARARVDGRDEKVGRGTCSVCCARAVRGASGGLPRDD